MRITSAGLAHAEFDIGRPIIGARRALDDGAGNEVRPSGHCQPRGVLLRRIESREPWLFARNAINAGRRRGKRIGDRRTGPRVSAVQLIEDLLVRPDRERHYTCS